jgi:hypothetical protein
MSDIEAPPDLTLCDREPITRLERIQSFGFLLAFTVRTRQASGTSRVCK